MGWVGRLIERRYTLWRLLLLDLSGVGYLMFGHEGSGLPRIQLLLAVAAFAAVLILYRWPFVSLLAQTALLAAALALVADPEINSVGTLWMLLEVALWTPRLSRLWLGTGLVAAVYLVAELSSSDVNLGRAVFGAAVTLCLPVLLGLVVRTSRELARQAEERAASESRAARADERTAIARELHDVVAHHVASMVLRVGVARHVLPGLEPEAREVFDDVHRTGTSALADLRRLVAVLRDPEGVRADAALTALEPSALPAALDGAVETARRTGLIVDADLSGPVDTLDAVRGLAVLRLTQEALTNVAKHAGPSAHAYLTLSVENDVIHWEVSDEGGLSNGKPPGGGHGIIGMRERVEVLGGTLEAGPFEKGWRVATVLPA